MWSDAVVEGAENWIQTFILVQIIPTNVREENWINGIEMEKPKQERSEESKLFHMEGEKTNAKSVKY